jgi:hypothetical protein
MRWKIVLEGTDEFGSARHRSELTIDKNLERLSAGEIGFSVEDGKAIMAHLQQVVVNQQWEALRFSEPFLYGLREVPTDQGGIVGGASLMIYNYLSVFGGALNFANKNR